MVFKKAFTIIELLVVIVIIGILAAVSIISYSNITSRADISVFQADLTNAKKQLMNFQSENGSFPARNQCPTLLSTDICLKSSSGYTFDTYASYSTSTLSFFLSETKNSTNTKYSITENTLPTSLNNIISDGLIVYLDAGNSASYQSPSTTWNDLSGNNNNATLYNGVSYSSTAGGTLVFDKVDDYVQGSITPSLFSPYAFTTITWFNASSVTSEQHLTNVKGVSQFYVKTGALGTSNYGNLSGGSVSTNTWYMASVSRRLNENSSIYLNNNEVSTGTLPAPGLTTAYVIGNYVSLGPYWFGGNIAISLIYKKALTTSEIVHNFNVLRGRFGV